VKVTSSSNTQLSTIASVINGPKLYPALGRGWSIANVDRLLDHDRQPDRTTDAFGNSLAPALSNGMSVDSVSLDTTPLEMSPR
jgi:hypothetical protein